MAQKSQVLGKDAEGFEAGLLQYMLSDPGLEKDERQMLEVFIPDYLSFYAGLEPGIREQVAEVARLSNRERLRPYPDLLDFLQTQQRMQELHPSEESAWLSTLISLLRRDKGRYFLELVRRTEDLILDACLYKSLSAHWKVSKPEFRFQPGNEPAFVFRNIDLSCRTASDSTFIFGLSGTFYPLDDRFEGKGGRTYWNRAGLSPDSCWADLFSYSLNLRTGRVEAEARLTNLYLFSGSIEGKYSERLFSGHTVSKNRYPRFVSRQDQVEVEDIYPGLDIKGPLVQQGNQMHFGTEEQGAELAVRDKDGLRIRLSAGRIFFGQEQLQIPEARMAMYLGNDSLYNPAVSVRFDNRERVLHVGEVKNSGLKSPYIDTYHQLRMDFEALRWYVDEGKVEFGLLDVPGREGVVTFKSLSMYSRNELGILMLGQDTDPFLILSSLSKKLRSQEFGLEALARYMGVSSTQALAFLKDLIAFGYVTYDPSSRKVGILPRMHHTMQVTAKKADFDELEFVTTAPGVVKATMDLDSLVLKMKGVPFVLLSRKQDMSVRPEDSAVEIYKNRDFHFDGILDVGAFHFDVRGGCFYYDAFKVDIADVRQLGLEVKTVEDGRDVLRPVVSKIRYLAGSVYIDNPSNKGGRKDYPQYPILESTQSSFVYYDEPYVQDGVYKADSFYFQVDPFRMDKLNTLQTDSISFAGTLVSAGIFPDIREELRVMPDFSLGFTRKTSLEGLPAYGQMARFAGLLTLDNSGLWGNGQFKYMESNSFSNRITLRPRDMDLHAVEFALNAGSGQGVEYPLVQGLGVNGIFTKEDGRFQVASDQDSLLQVFGPEWELRGFYEFSPSLSSACGELRKIGEAQVSAERFSVWRRGFASDSGSLRIGDLQGPAFLETGDCSLDVDLDRQAASFHSLGGRSPLEFGLNQYRGHVASLYWDMRKKDVNLCYGDSSGIGMPGFDTLSKGALFTAELPGEYFESTRKAQAGLGFHATSSVLSYADTVLSFSGVRRLLVADALFVPAQGNLTVEKTGVLAPLTGAELYFGDRARLHSFHGVAGRVVSANQYRVSGFFDYKAPGLEVQPVYFAGIRPMNGGHSRAEARLVADSSVLDLNEAFQFIGKMEIDARQTYPFFSGSARMVYACSFPEAGEAEYGFPEEENISGYDDFEYASEEAGAGEVSSAQESYDDFEYSEDEGTGDNRQKKENAKGERQRKTDSQGSSKRKGNRGEEEVLLPGEEAEGIRPGNPFLSDGFQFEAYINSDSVLIPVTGQTRSTTGRLLGCGFYTQTRSREPMFRFMQRKISNDLKNIELSGWLGFSGKDQAYQVWDSTGRRVLDVSMDKCLATAKGVIDLDVKLPAFRIGVWGDMIKESSGAIKTRALTVFDFFLPQVLSGLMAEILNAQIDLEGVEIAPGSYVDSYLERTLPGSRWEEVKEGLARTGVLEVIPEGLRQALVFPDLELEWDPETETFFGSGQTAVLALGGIPVNKKMKAYVSLRKTRRGDEVDIYLEAARNKWLYFSCGNNVLQIFSSDEGFNQFVSKMRDSQLREGRFMIYLATMSKKNTFVRNFEAARLPQNPY